MAAYPDRGSVLGRLPWEPRACAALVYLRQAHFPLPTPTLADRLAQHKVYKEFAA